MHLVWGVVLGCSPTGPAAGPGPAPFTLVQQHGFSRVEDAPGRQRWSSPPGSGCMAQLDWWRPFPDDPGGPMAVGSKRPVTVAGQQTEVLHTTAFDGIEQVVDVVMLPGKGFHARLVFEGCNDAEIDGFLKDVR